MFWVTITRKLLFESSICFVILAASIDGVVFDFLLFVLLFIRDLQTLQSKRCIKYFRNNVSQYESVISFGEQEVNGYIYGYLIVLIAVLYRFYRENSVLFFMAKG